MNRDFPGQSAFGDFDGANADLPRFLPIVTSGICDGTADARVAVIDLSDSQVVYRGVASTIATVLANAQRAIVHDRAARTLTTVDHSLGQPRAPWPVAGMRNDAIVADDFRFGRLWVASAAPRTQRRSLRRIPDRSRSLSLAPSGFDSNVWCR